MLAPVLMKLNWATGSALVIAPVKINSMLASQNVRRSMRRYRGGRR